MLVVISCEVHESSPPQIDPPDGSLAGRAGNRRRSLASAESPLVRHCRSGTAVAIGSSGGGGGGGGVWAPLSFSAPLRSEARLHLTSGGGGGGGIADSFRAVLGPIPWVQAAAAAAPVGGGGVSGTEMKTRDEGLSLIKVGRRGLGGGGGAMGGGLSEIVSWMRDEGLR